MPKDTDDFTVKNSEEVATWIRKTRDKNGKRVSLSFSRKIFCLKCLVCVPQINSERDFVHFSVHAHRFGNNGGV